MSLPIQYALTAPAPAVQNPPPDLAPALEEAPIYANAKQLDRILKRCLARQSLEKTHKHAMRRPRGPGGRFLTADEVAGLKNKGDSDGRRREGKLGTRSRRAGE